MSLRRGAALADEGRYEEAVTAFEEAARARPGAAGPPIQKALCQLAMGQPEAAADSLARAVELEPGNPAPQLFLALTRSELADQDGAELMLQSVKKICPDHQAADTVRALVQLRKGMLDKAVAYLGSRPDLSLSSPIISRLVLEIERLLLPGDIPLLLRRPAEIPEERENPPSRGLFASVRAWRGQSVGRKRVEQAMRQPPGSDRRHQMLEQSVEILTRARDSDPAQFRADFYLAEARLYAARPRHPEPAWLERLRQSREGFLVSWRHEGENPYLLYYLGRVSLNLGEVEAAITYFERSLEKFAKFPESHYGLGQAWLLKGDPQKAREYFAQALRSDTFILRDRVHELVSRFESEPESLQLQLPPWEPEVEEISTPDPPEVPAEPPL